MPDITYPEMQAGVMLPIRIKGVPPNPAFKEATGVDDYSIKSSNPDQNSSATYKPIKDRIWIMAPVFGQTKASFKTPINSQSPLTLSANGVQLDGEDHTTLESESNIVNIGALDAAKSGQDIPMNIKINAASSISQPIGIKIMRHRLVPVIIHKLNANHLDGIPSIIPDENQLNEYLNSIYSPQINISFNIIYGSDLDVNWDTNGNGFLDGGASLPSNDQQICYNSLPDASKEFSIRIFLISSQTLINTEALGITFIGLNSCWIYARNNSSTINWTIAHEIGHLLFKGGHPEDLNNYTPLPGTNPASRMMSKWVKPNGGVRVVKGEWDWAESWLVNEENSRRIPN